MLSVLVDNSVLKTRAEKPSAKESNNIGNNSKQEKPIEMYSFLEKAETDSKNSDVEPLYDGPKYVKPKRNTRCVLTSICLAIVIIGVLASLALLAYKLSTLYHGKKNEGNQTADLQYHVNTSIGYLSGVVENQVYVFKGVPYAQPPVGKLRWKPPVAFEDTVTSNDWESVRKADLFPNKCFQYEAYYQEGNIGNEDCLYLNIWTPDLSSTAGLNVMVFIHGGGTETDIGQLYGGGLMSGSGHESGMMPDAEIAKTANMVFVSLNYRLGPLGFLALNITDPVTKKPITGNYGFMDQTLALQWINRNIRSFGGDPNKVTVFGVGAGATSIFALLASNKTSALFQKAWLASPSPNFDTNLTAAFQQNQEILTKLTSSFDAPCHGRIASELYKCLQDLSPEEVMNAVPLDKWINPHFRDLPQVTEKPIALAIIDGAFLTDPISTVWHKGQGSFKDVHMLIGSSAQEVDDWPFPKGLASWTWDKYDKYVEKNFPDSQYRIYVPNLAEKAKAMYPHHISAEYQLTSMISDIRQVCGVSLMSQLIASKWNAPVYRYITAYFKNMSQLTQESSSSHPSSNSTSSSYSRDYVNNDDMALDDSHYNYPSSSSSNSDNNKNAEILDDIPQDDSESDGGDQYYYHDNIDESITPGFRYAYHGIDMQYFFNELSSASDQFTSDDARFVSNMRTTVFRFVRNEDMRGGVAGWTAYPHNTTVISSQIQFSPSYKQSECSLWMDSWFLPQHTWMN